MTKRFEKASKILTWVVLIHSLVFIIFWLTNTPFHLAVNDFIADQAGKAFDYVLLPILLSAGIGIWCLIRIAFGKRYAKLMRGSKVHFALCIVFLMLFYALFAVLFSREPIQLPRLVQLFSFFRPIVEIPILVLLVILTLPMVARAYRLRKEQPPYAVALVALWVFAWSLSLWNPPDSVYRGALPDKPMLIAHRGASMLAPENTLSAVKMAALIANRGVVKGADGLELSNQNNQGGSMGVETDIRISLDGILFLMHDPTLKRTTNIASIFPDRKNENASQFSIADLQKISAGQWFVDSHPAGSLPSGLVSNEQIKAYAVEPIPTLQDWLQVVKDNHLIFIFDLLPPPENHPYYDQFFTLCFNQIKQTGIDNQIWFLVDESNYWKVHAAGGQIHLVHSTDYRHPPAVSDLQYLSFEIVNSEYGLPVHWLHEYQAAHIKVNIWTIDEGWQFSRLWVLGVNSVTTNNVHNFAAENYPILAIPYRVYVIVWCGLAILLGAYVVLRGKKY